MLAFQCAIVHIRSFIRLREIYIEVSFNQCNVCKLPIYKNVLFFSSLVFNKETYNLQITKLILSFYQNRKGWGLTDMRNSPNWMSIVIFRLWYHQKYPNIQITKLSGLLKFLQYSNSNTHNNPYKKCKKSLEINFNLYHNNWAYISWYNNLNMNQA